MKMDGIERSLLLGLAFVLAGAIGSWSQRVTLALDDDFDARWERCTQLSKEEATRVNQRERGLDRLNLPEVPQLIEDCMDDGSPINELYAKWR